ncbi:conserved hypothetical protein [Ricinus communis]|uniref:Uncharacterized protein n=1 Tax=Ricinus communis TaxID=3988 RepID=B9S5J8_RICCO|nr:conserved hypothetical protein [Ricinus communis]
MWVSWTNLNLEGDSSHVLRARDKENVTTLSGKILSLLRDMSEVECEMKKLRSKLIEFEFEVGNLRRMNRWLKNVLGFISIIIVLVVACKF